MSNLVVVRDEIDGWDVVRDDDSPALTNHPDKETAIAAAKLRAAEEGDEDVVVDERHVHHLDDARRGTKTYFLAVLGLLAAITVVIVITSLLASWTGI